MGCLENYGGEITNLIGEWNYSDDPCIKMIYCTIGISRVIRIRNTSNSSMLKLSQEKENRTPCRDSCKTLDRNDVDVTSFKCGPMNLKCLEDDLARVFEIYFQCE